MNPERICYGCFQEKDPGSVCPHCGFHEYEDQPYLALPLGAILNGRYLVGKVLGIGGFGITYLGFDLTLEIKVAIKEYLPSGLATRHSDHYTVQLTRKADEDYTYGMNRFLEEARVLARLQNTPNIVSVQNYFKENNTAYFVMEYIDGMSLKEFLDKAGGKIPLAQAKAILEPVMAALTEVHALNLLHRDISPDNIYITAKGESRLLDFGAARFALGDGKSVSIILKHGYAPEEQYSSRGNQGPWTDVYAMGATLYRCLTGILPPDSLERINNDILKSPAELGIQLPERVEQALRKALAVKTADRFPNMESFIDALNEKSGADSKDEKDRIKAPRLPKEKEAPVGKDSPGQKRSYPKFIVYLNENPKQAKILSAVVLLLVAFSFILPMLLSGKDNGYQVPDNGTLTLPRTLPGTIPGTMPMTTPGTTPQTQPGTVPDSTTPTQPDGPIKYTLGNLNAAITMPPGYVLTGSERRFVHAEKDSEIFIEHYWRYVVPIYSLADVAAHQAEIVAILMSSAYSDHQIISSGSQEVNGQDGYVIQVHGTEPSGGSREVLINAVEGQTPFGAYFIISQYPYENEAIKNEIYSIVHSFEVTGPGDFAVSLRSFVGSGIKFILNDSLALGGVQENTYNLPDGTPYYRIRVYPTEDNITADWDRNSPSAGGIELMHAAMFGTTPEEVVAGFHTETTSAGNSYQDISDVYTEAYGGITWTLQNYTDRTYTYRYGAAEIEGELYSAYLMYNTAIEEASLALWVQLLSSLRPI